jgi:hypothetical protein
MGARKETEGPRASAVGAGKESPEEDGYNPCPVNVDCIEENKQEYDPSQHIEEDRTLVIPDNCGGPV